MARPCSLPLSRAPQLYWMDRSSASAGQPELEIALIGHLKADHRTDQWLTQKRDEQSVTCGVMCSRQNLPGCWPKSRITRQRPPVSILLASATRNSIRAISQTRQLITHTDPSTQPDSLRHKFFDPGNILIHPALQKLATGCTNLAGFIDQAILELNKCLRLSHGRDIQKSENIA